MNIKTLIVAPMFSLVLTWTTHAQVTAQYTTTADWGTGFSGVITITNPGAQPISGWTFAFDFSGSITSIFSAVITSHVGNRYTVIGGSGMTTIPAGGSVTFGITGTPGGITPANAPSNFTFNGTPTGSQPPAPAISSAFTYQGRLTDGASAANGAYDLEFGLYDEAGTQISITLVRRGTSVTNGIFSAELDFGEAAFSGAKRYLEIRVRPAGSAGALTVLTPRQSITSVPYAFRAQNAMNVSGGFVQLPLTTGAPPAAECDEAVEYGRQKVDAFGNRLYICTAGGWKSVILQ